MKIAIIVFFNPDKDLLGYKKIIEECDYTVIVDNSLCYNEIDSKLVEKFNYIPLYENKGIASAQNMALNHIFDKFEKNLDDIFIIQFDQDSIIESGYTQNLITSYTGLEQTGVKVGVLGPQPINKYTSELYRLNQFSTSEKLINLSDNYSYVDCVISSGCIARANVFFDAGVFDDRLFIDSVDHEWCWKLRIQGYENIVDKNILLAHYFGESNKSFLGLSLRCGTPVRYYYSFRNWILLSKLTHVPIKYKIRTLFFIPIKLVVYMSLFDRKWERMTYMLKGILDGIKGKGGPYG